MNENYYYYIVFNALDRKDKTVTGSVFFNISRPIESKLSKVLGSDIL